MSESARDGSAYRLQTVLNGVEIQSAADKVKPRAGEEQWLTQPQRVFIPEEVAPEPLPGRAGRQAP